MDINKPIETKYKVEVADKSKRKRVIKENIAKITTKENIIFSDLEGLIFSIIK